MKQTMTALFLAGLWLSPPAPVMAELSDATAVLERVRAAVGHVDADSVTLQGRADFLDNDVSYRLDIGTSGTFSERFGGPFAVADGYDGRTTWMVDIGGETRHLHFSEAEIARITGQILTHAWLGEDGRLEIDEQVVAGDALITLSFVHRDGLATGTVEIGVDTWRPRRWSLQGLSAAEYVIVNEGALEDSDRWFPSVFTIGETDGQMTRVTLERAVPLTELSAAPAPGVPADTRFNPERSPRLEVVRGPHGHLLVHPAIHGRDLGWFVFDSGAGITALDSRAVQALELEPLATTTAQGVGGRTEAPLHRLESLSLGPMTVADLAVAEFDFAFLDEYMGRPVAGVVGLSIFSRAVVELDQRAAAVALHDPAAFDDTAYEWLDMQLDHRLPVVGAQFESHQGLFGIDSGYAGNVTFFPRAVEQLDLLAGRNTKEGQLRGVGGEVAVREGRLEWFQLGSHRSEGLRVSFLQGTESAQSQWITGRVGIGVLEPFVILFDYPGARLALVPSGNN